ncbi:MAG: Glucose 1-dehydrogenase 2 [Alphaproteobacteria bacterium MarineAlpha11_Bin1]|nr:MAG: Glucose 1-dehydrogenase 2 [Alphaproteobacteria bacterium MarineAlpha11_Bin1]|tara:strand:- start:6093 stop:6941 length:849 start_codon:yes stop_codon:yes gene_type:complete
MKHTPEEGPQGPAAYPCLSGRSIIVTGGGQGIGRHMALALAERGASVVITVARDPESLNETVALAADLAGEVAPLQADIRNLSDCERTLAFAISEFGSVQALVNNAARGISYVRETTGGEPVPFWETDRSRWVETMTTNVIGTFQMSAIACEYMIENNFGRIINVSTSDRSMTREMNSPYGPSKAALEAMSVAWAKEGSTKGVTVNVLLPGGATNTRMVTGVTKRTPLPPDIMNASILWLCSDASKDYTGGRYKADDWDTKLEPECAAAGARTESHQLPIIM